MNKCPKVGDKVSYPGGLVVGPCTGTVTAIYVSHYSDYLEDEDCDEEIYRKRRGPMPEREWHVAVKVDRVPEKWCYTGSDTFAPEVKTMKRG